MKTPPAPPVFHLHRFFSLVSILLATVIGVTGTALLTASVQLQHWSLMLLALPLILLGLWWDGLALCQGLRVSSRRSHY